MSETQINDEVAKNILNLIDLAQTVASLPITKLTNDEVAVLQEMAKQHLTQKTLMEALAVTDADLARTSMTPAKRSLAARLRRSRLTYAWISRW